MPEDSSFSDASATAAPRGDPVCATRAAMRAPLPKRFYAQATSVAGEGGHRLLLDGRPALTPGRKVLAVPSRALAEALAAEWAAQGERIDPATMPLTKLVNTTIDRVLADPGAVVDDAAKFAGSDLLCYRAGEPERLVVLQAEAWDPMLAWAHLEIGARFVLSQGVTFVTQPEASLAAVRAAVAAVPAFALGALHVVTTLTGSVLLALALQRGFRDGAAVWQAAHVDEDFQASLWGEDAEAAARRAERRREFDAAVEVLRHAGDR